MPFIGVAEITLLRYWDSLASLPGFMIRLAFKEVQNVFVDSLLWRVVHGFEGFWRDAAEVCCFALFEFGDGTVDFAECNRGIDVGKAWLLWDEVNDRVVNWSVVIKDFMEVHTED